MSKKFNIHEWQAKQAKQRLVENDFKRLRHPEEFKFLDGLKADNKINRWGITSLQTRFGLSDEKAIEIFNLYTSSVGDRALPTRGEDMNESLNPEVSRSLDKFIRAMADRYDYTMQDAVYAIMAALKQRNYDGLEEHHAGDYNPGFLKQSVSTFLDKLKKKTKEGPDYETVEKIMEKHFSAKKEVDENTLGTGTSFNAGSGEGYMTPNAFKKKKKK